MTVRADDGLQHANGFTAYKSDDGMNNTIFGFGNTMAWLHIKFISLIQNTA
jgi:hypothetical protein